MMKALLLTGCLLAFFGLASSTAAADVDGGTCIAKGIKLYGKVKVVEFFPDLRVQVVESFPDLKVQVVTSFPDKCGKWQFVDSFPDFTIQYVESFPDIKVKFVKTFPGVP